MEIQGFCIYLSGTPFGFLLLSCLEMLNEVKCFGQLLLFFLWGFICCKVSPVCFDFLISHIYCLLQDHVLLCSLMGLFGFLQVGWDSVMRMSVNLRDLFLYEAFLYYNPLLLVVSYFCFERH